MAALVSNTANPSTVETPATSEWKVELVWLASVTIWALQLTVLRSLPFFVKVLRPATCPNHEPEPGPARISGLVRHGLPKIPYQNPLVSSLTDSNIKGRSELMLQMYRVGNYNVQSHVVAFRGPSQGKKTGKDAAIGAAGGGGLGLLFGGGKGAAWGAGLGAGAGVAHRAFKGGKPVRIGSESLVNFRLAAPIHVRR
jgi:hypothetical protein